MAVILSAIGRIIAIEKTVGISLGHTDATAILNRVIESLQGSRGNAQTATTASPLGDSRNQRSRHNKTKRERVT